MKTINDEMSEYPSMVKSIFPPSKLFLKISITGDSGL
jgi:hypothetical protein